MKRLAVCGSTGSSESTHSDVVLRNRSRYEVFALTAHSNVDRLAAQCRRWRPRFAAMSDESAAARLAAALSTEVPETRVLAGVSGLVQVAMHPDVDYVMAAIVGGAGLMPSLAAARSGKRVLLASKEALVMSGPAVHGSGARGESGAPAHRQRAQCDISMYAYGKFAERRAWGATYPVDRFRRAVSHTRPRIAARDHSGRCMCSSELVHGTQDIRRLGDDDEQGLEVIEACWLFDVDPGSVEVLVHPQSVIHSMVEYEDGSVLAQLGNPDMRTPIAHALAWPDRIASGVTPLDLVSTSRLDFGAPDFGRFPCLRLGFEAAEAGGAAPATLNAANEVAVDAFLNRRLRFTRIAGVAEATVAACAGEEPRTLDDVLELDGLARVRAAEFIKAMPN